MAEKSVTEEVLESPESFDFNAFITGNVSYPTREAKVVLNRAVVLQARELAEEIADVDAEKSEAQLTDLAPSPEYDEKLEALKTQLEEVLAKAEQASLTFVLRGVPPKVWKVADKALRQKFKKQKNLTEDERIELDIKFQEEINADIVHKCTVEVIDPHGAKSNPKKADIEKLAGMLDQHEWEKLVSLANQLTFEISNLDDAIGTNSDFLPKS